VKHLASKNADLSIVANRNRRNEGGTPIEVSFNDEITEYLSQVGQNKT